MPGSFAPSTFASTSANTATCASGCRISQKKPNLLLAKRPLISNRIADRTKLRYCQIALACLVTIRAHLLIDAPVLVLETDDVVLAQVITGLHFDESEIGLGGIRN